MDKDTSIKTLGTVFLVLAVLVVVAVVLFGGGDGPEERPAGEEPVAAAEEPVPAPDPAAPELPRGGFEVEPYPAPDFTLPTLEGGTFDLSEHRGEVVVLNFWATWCGPCRIEIPDFVRLQEELGDEGVQFVGVSLDEAGFEVVRPFAEEFGINYPLVVDDGALAEQYGGVYGLPTTFIIDREGRVRRAVPGMMTEEMLRPMLEELLAG